VVSQYQGCRAPLEEAEVLIELAREAGDANQEEDLAKLLDLAESRVDSLELARLLAGENDTKGAYLTINSGAGGTESQDWGEMLLRMYLRYADMQGWNSEIIDYLPGDEAGLKSVNVQIDGDFAYGYLKAENGIHRLVRISPFDAAKRRHTSFASVFVYPQIDDSIHVDIDEKDLRIDVYRASGAGGQKVNKTSSAVRITHIPTNIVVQCQNERSQYKNKDMAMRVLMARLVEHEQRKQDAEKQQIEASKMRIDFGSQIRSYVLAPYRLVKDHRTSFEMGNADAVLDGHIHGFIKAWLLAAAGKERASERDG
jgi:peptide chain release factor 2